MSLEWQTTVHNNNNQNTHIIITTFTLRMEEVSSISAMKVEIPFNCESPAPTLAEMESTIQIDAESHGTKHPICAINTATPIYTNQPLMIAST